MLRMILYMLFYAPWVLILPEGPFQLTISQHPASKQKIMLKNIFFHSKHFQLFLCGCPEVCYVSNEYTLNTLIIFKHNSMVQVTTMPPFLGSPLKKFSRTNPFLFVLAEKEEISLISQFFSCKVRKIMIYKIPVFMQ